MNEIERLRAELAAAEREVAEANGYLAAVRAGDTKAKPPKSKPKTKPKTKPKAKKTVHRSGLSTSIEGYGGPAPVGTSRARTSNRPVITKHFDPRERPGDYTYEGRECLYAFDIKNGMPDSDSWKRCKCVACGEYK
jgi:hypothetical protein